MFESSWACFSYLPCHRMQFYCFDWCFIISILQFLYNTMVNNWYFIVLRKQTKLNIPAGVVRRFQVFSRDDVERQDCVCSRIIHFWLIPDSTYNRQQSMSDGCSYCNTLYKIDISGPSFRLDNRAIQLC